MTEPKIVSISGSSQASRELTAVKTSARQDLSTDFDRRPVEVSERPIPRSKNPAHQHLLAQPSEASRASKRHLANTLARMLGAPVVIPREDANDKRVRDYDGLAYPYEYVHWETLSLEGYRAIVQMITHDPLDPDSDQPRYRAAATVNAYVAVLRGIAREAWVMEMITHDLLERIRSIKPTMMKSLPKGKAQPERVINALLGVCDLTTARGSRDASIITLMVLTGLRRSEALRIYLSDLDTSQKEIKIHGKGRKERLVLPPIAAWDHLQHWLSFRGCEPGPLYVGIPNNVERVRTVEKPMSLHSLNVRLEALRSKACVAGNMDFEISPHHLRHTFATDLHKANVDLLTIQTLLNHASPNTTRGYIMPEEEAARKKAAAINAGRFSMIPIIE